MAEGMHLCGGSTAPTLSLCMLLCLQHDPNGLLRAPLVDGCDLDKSLAKVFRIIFMAVETSSSSAAPYSRAIYYRGSCRPSRKSRRAKPAAVIFDGLAI